jgi:hypothetical protein
MRTVRTKITAVCAALGFTLAVQTAASADEPAKGEQPPAAAEPPKVEGEAKPPAGPVTKETYPSAYIDRPLTLVTGQLQIGGATGLFAFSPINIGLTTGAEFKAVLIAPAVAYGVTDQLQLSLYHSRSICVGDACAKAYNDVAIAAHYYLLTEGKFLLAAHLNVPIDSFDPFGMSIGAGALMQITLASIFAIWVDPTISVKVTPSPVVASLSVPVWLGFQLTPEFFAGLLTGFNVATFEDFGNSWSIPLGVAAMYTISRIIDVGLEFSFPVLFTNGSTNSDAKQLGVIFAVRI